MSNKVQSTIVQEKKLLPICASLNLLPYKNSSFDSFFNFSHKRQQYLLELFY